MLYKFDLVYQEYHFIITLQQSTEPSQPERAHLSIHVQRKDVLGTEWKWQDYLTSEPVGFQLVHPDNINIKGHFRLFYSKITLQNLVFLSARYGPAYKSQFEGNICQLMEPVVPEPPPPPEHPLK